MTALNFSDPAFFQNPYPFYAEMRKRNEPVWIPADPDIKSEGIWLFSKYAEVEDIFKLTRQTSKNICAIRNTQNTSLFDLNMLNMDGEAHLRMRKLVSHFFATRNLTELTPSIEETIEQLLGEMIKKDHFDLVKEFAEPLPMRIILKIMGIPNEDAQMIRAWSLAASPAFDSMQSSDEQLNILKIQIIQEFLAYLGTLVQDRKKLTEESLLHYLVTQKDRGEITENELLGMAIFLIFAGHETTISLISSALFLLISSPGQWKSLRQNNQLASLAVEETLRYESPAQRSTFRIVTEPVKINGFEVAPGQQITAIIGAANRDDAIFRQADCFDISRSPNPHLSFGYGLHNCLGKSLARIEACAALQRITRQYTHLNLATVQPIWRKNSFFRGLESLMVTPA